jgi:hypothetical protein
MAGAYIPVVYENRREREAKGWLVCRNELFATSQLFFSTLFFFSIDGAAAASKVRVLYGEQLEWRVEVGVLLMGLLWVRPGMWWGEVHVGVGD